MLDADLTKDVTKAARARNKIVFFKSRLALTKYPEGARPRRILLQLGKPLRCRSVEVPQDQMINVRICNCASDYQCGRFRI